MLQQSTQYMEYSMYEKDETDRLLHFAPNRLQTSSICKVHEKVKLFDALQYLKNLKICKICFRSRARV